MLALLGLVGGLDVDSTPLWRVGAYLLLAVVSYLHGRRVDSRHGWWIFAGAGVAGCGIGAVVSVPEGTSALLMLGIVVVLPWLAGRYRRQQALLIEAERERVRQLEREQEHIAERARLHERGLVAAELHDSLGHELALIALRAGALELSPELEPRHQQAAGEMRASAVTATDRLRQVLEMLRDRDRDRDDVPPVEEIVARARAAGMTVTLDGVAPMPLLIDQAVRRVIREALTNAVRHAPGAPVQATVDVTSHRVTVRVSNPANTPVGRGSGSGLVGLAERLRLLGGHLETTFADGRFELVALVPVT
jgi:signal transduction histidine kinase